MEDKQVGTCSK